MSIHESAIGLEYLISKLSSDSVLANDAPGGVFRVMAAPTTQPPYTIIASHSGADVLSMNGFRIMTDLLYQVFVAGPSAMMSQIISAASRVDDLLRLSSGMVTGGYVLSCIRESPIELDEEVVGELWLRMGGLYRLYVQQTS